MDLVWKLLGRNDPEPLFFTIGKPPQYRISSFMIVPLFHSNLVTGNTTKPEISKTENTKMAKIISDQFQGGKSNLGPFLHGEGGGGCYNTGTNYEMKIHQSVRMVFY